MKVCSVCGTSEDKAEIFGVTHGRELGCSACIGATHFPIRVGDHVHITSMRATTGVVERVATFRTRTPYWVKFSGGEGRAFAAVDLRLCEVPCPTCRTLVPVSVDGWALCPKCQKRFQV